VIIALNNHSKKLKFTTTYSLSFKWLIIGFLGW